MQQKYEVIYILDPSVSAEESQAVAAKVEQIAVDAKGSVIKKEEWGRRRLAYTVQKQREGIYWFFHLAVDATVVAELGRNLRLFEKVIKFMITKDEVSGRKKTPPRIKTSTLHSAQARPMAPKPGEIKPADIKPVDVKPAEIKPVDVKPAGPVAPAQP
jgi:small subunit ribosomal protein S6